MFQKLLDSEKKTRAVRERGEGGMAGNDDHNNREMLLVFTFLPTPTPCSAEEEKTLGRPSQLTNIINGTYHQYRFLPFARRGLPDLSPVYQRKKKKLSISKNTKNK